MVFRNIFTFEVRISLFCLIFATGHNTYSSFVNFWYCFLCISVCYWRISLLETLRYQLRRAGRSTVVNIMNFSASRWLNSCKSDPWCKIVFVKFCSYVQICLRAKKSSCNFVPSRNFIFVKFRPVCKLYSIKLFTLYVFCC